jgi:spore maturation protein SpmA
MGITYNLINYSKKHQSKHQEHQVSMSTSNIKRPCLQSTPEVFKSSASLLDLNASGEKASHALSKHVFLNLNSLQTTQRDTIPDGIVELSNLAAPLSTKLQTEQLAEVAQRDIGAGRSCCSLLLSAASLLFPATVSLSVLCRSTQI